jgi:hypothetical protein
VYGAATAERQLAALLGDHGERQPGALELGDDRVLGDAVDDERDVTALTAAGGLGALRERGALHRASRRGLGAAADLQPVGVERRLGGGKGHGAHMLTGGAPASGRRARWSWRRRRVRRVP